MLELREILFLPVECVSGEERKRQGERWSRGAEKLEKLPTSELVLPLHHTAEEERVVITEIQWTLRNRRPFFSVDRLLESISHATIPEKYILRKEKMMWMNARFVHT